MYNYITISLIIFNITKFLIYKVTHKGDTAATLLMQIISLLLSAMGNQITK